jgi:hypothetical protein
VDIRRAVARAGRDPGLSEEEMRRRAGWADEVWNDWQCEHDLDDF